MTSNYYAVYIEKVRALAATLVIKTADAADAINKGIAGEYGSNAVNSLDPRTWKYYLNLSGEYHPLDTVMTVTSLDTQEEISFTKDNLRIHRATARAYVYGTRKYLELVARYPTQVALINGVLYPVDIDYAIDADDGTILGWPADLIEVNEYTLMERLQEWVHNMRARWWNPQYGVSDELYLPAFLGILYLGLVPAILNLRLESCKTNEAHSYHVREYLGSHGIPDEYLVFLTTKQALWLYRNIAYIERNSGQQNVFEWCTEHIMTERRLPLDRYVMRHDLSEMPDAITPTLAFERTSVNMDFVAGNDPVITLGQLLNKERSLALQNPIYVDEDQSEINEQLTTSTANVLPTKVLESQMVDYSDSTPHTLEDTLLNHWIFLASKSGYYTPYIRVTDAKTGEPIPMTVKEAVVFMIYAVCKSELVTPIDIPLIAARRVQRIPTPSVDELYSVCDHSIVPREVIEAAWSIQPEIVPMISTEAFLEKGQEIFVAANKQRDLVAYQEEYRRRGYVAGAVEQLYSTNLCEVADEAGQTFHDWFTLRNIAYQDYTTDEWGLMYLDVIKKATGLDLVNTQSLKALQAAMVSLLARLSAYNVQFLAEINQSGLRVVDWPIMRVGDFRIEGGATFNWSDLAVRVLRGYASGKMWVWIDLGRCGFQQDIRATVHDTYNLLINTKVGSEGVTDRRQYRLNGSVGMSMVKAPVESPNSFVPIPGMELYDAMTPAQQLRMQRDIYSDWNPTYPDPGING